MTIFKICVGINLFMAGFDIAAGSYGWAIYSVVLTLVMLAIVYSEKIRDSAFRKGNSAGTE